MFHRWLSMRPLAVDSQRPNAVSDKGFHRLSTTDNHSVPNFLIVQLKGSSPMRDLREDRKSLIANKIKRLFLINSRSPLSTTFWIFLATQTSHETI
jgi:hypothetical protein